MTNSAPRSNTLLTLSLIVAITAWRILCLAFNQVDLFVDEAQYWLWGQELAFGTYSKPPLIGWVIRLSTEIGGSDAPFWIKLPAPIGYALAAIAVGRLAANWWPRNAANWAGVAFATLPGVGVLSLFISTDAILLPLFALAMLALFALAQRPGTGWAVVLGLAVGAGLLAKYAMVYFIGLAALAWVLGMARPRGRDLLLAGAVALLVFAPNIWWNMTHGFITLSHTAGNAGWEGIAWNWGGVATFLGVQILALGPVLGLAYVWRLGRGDRGAGFAPLVLFSLPLFLAVSVQALIREANGNWAAPALLAATALVVPYLYMTARRVLWVGLAVNAALVLALPLAPVFPQALRVNGQPVMERALGLREVTEQVLATAEAQGLPYVIAVDRRLLADLTYLSKGRAVQVLAQPAAVGAPPGSHYQLTRPARADTVPALYVSLFGVPLGCADSARVVRTWQPDSGALRRNEITLFTVTAPCFLP